MSKTISFLIGEVFYIQIIYLFFLGKAVDMWSLGIIVYILLGDYTDYVDE